MYTVLMHIYNIRIYTQIYIYIYIYTCTYFTAKNKDEHFSHVHPVSPKNFYHIRFDGSEAMGGVEDANQNTDLFFCEKNPSRVVFVELVKKNTGF